MKRYNFNTENENYVSEIIKWKYEISSQSDTKKLFDGLKKLDLDAKIEAPHFLQLSYLASSYVQPIYVYYLNDIGFQLNTNGTVMFI